MAIKTNSIAVEYNNGGNWTFCADFDSIDAIIKHAAVSHWDFRFKFNAKHIYIKNGVFN